MRSTLSTLLLAAIAALPVGAQDISIVASSCAADDFLAAAGAPGNPCEATDYVCQCTTGKQFTQDYLTKALTADPGTCTPQDIAGQSCSLAISHQAREEKTLC
ncbi:hypothetical protein MPH_08089 [Macrophomina phaseolina MS6]|uniref:Extracellular membrane protein CFEM domain-containing protein n=1 Tax=Macrophomina phaseolina (strain MS6) TaxID=1126212 RepID=K2RX66_MACPH|nr:hypothetical protein MPH_08089 [Macrophomina phaseolina MS6]